MPRPSVAIVGRPNVGKSTLFNALVGSRIAIEADIAGVTRDRVLFPLELEDRVVDLIDTGGIGMVDVQHLESLVETQIDVAIAEADLLIFLVDTREGITPLDEEIAGRLRKVDVPVLLAANKADTGAIEDMLPSFHALGFGDALPISAKQRRNLDDLEEAILSRLPPLSAEEEPGTTRELLKIAIVGKRNAGKSSVVNRLAGDERAIVSEAPGTTRDALDIIIEQDGERSVVIDTAGMRKRGQMDDVMEFYGHVRSERAIRRADVVVLLMDATLDASRVDKQLGALIMEEHKPCILALNKWDIVREQRPGITLADFQKYIDDRFPGMYFCRLVGLSAKTGENVSALVQSARELADQARREINTGQLNLALEKAQQKRRPRPKHGKSGRIYYGTQVDTAPPTFLLFCNYPYLFDDSYQRYLAHQLREGLGFDEVPLRLVFRGHRQKS